ncbi:alkaline phosphatase PafA [Hanstruepera marina]|uniref:alkaline phosphatase PafA n=1 Tax=Hanstruepera marina TaxID=2873265 RepID=UPI00210257D7|nr:alkaline phosphatase PafA [Hanstruepera marina]
MKNQVLFLLLVFSFLTVKAQYNEPNNRPKLVVGIVVDQMRYDYLTRFYNKYGEGGFKRMIRDGFNCKNNHFNYIPTKTAPGHASIFTGTTPKFHGIIGNDWFDKKLGENVYCVNDNSFKSVGTDNKKGQMSPHRMLTTTFADENRLFTQMRGKTIGVSIKDRGAVLPAGHTANAAYWVDDKGTGNWISSSFYMKELPNWVKRFNESNKTEQYFKTWDTYYDIDSYTESGDDLNTFEGGFSGKETATFPYDLNALKADNGNYKIIVETPYGNSLITDFTLELLKEEGLGKDNYTDVLTVSYSSTDKVGHNFGVNSKEVEDTYIRLDLDLERLFKALDDEVGADNYVVFLTADHGAPNVPSYLQSNKIPAGLFDLNAMVDALNSELEEEYGVKKLILSRINNQIFFNHKKISKSNLDLSELKERVSNKLLQYRLIDKVYTTSDGNQLELANGYLENMLMNGHNQKRSGDIVFVFNPAVFKDTLWNRTGTDHHSGLNYDTHVPLLFFGKGIAKGSTLQRTNITDIAPTISALLNISLPNGAIGNPLEFVFETQE